MSPEVSTPVDQTQEAELAPLKDAGYPLQPLNLPTVRREGGSVHYTAMVPGGANSPDYLKAFATLEANGCEVAVDPLGAENFARVQVRVPEGVLSPESILAICEAIAARAEAQTRIDATPQLDPNEDAQGC